MNMAVLHYNNFMAIAQIQIRSLDHLLLKRHEIATSNTLPVGLPDAAAYCFVKEATFLNKKQQRWYFYLFQGLNTNPQNLSIYLRDEAARESKGSKQKLGKGVFMVWDMFNRVEVVVEINIPGNLRIYKLQNGKKQLVSNQEMDLMYLSSAFRAMYQSNLPWGRTALLFHDSKNYLEQLRSFFAILFRSLLKKDITVSGQFQSGARVKGSHGCSLVFNYLKERKLIRQGIEIIEDLFGKSKQYKNCFKYGVLLSEMYMQFGKPSKSLEIIFRMLEQHPKKTYLFYYQSRYLLESGLYDQALTVAQAIVQYNQLQIWILLAQIHLQLKNYSQLLICLNHAVKMAKIKACKNTDVLFRGFEELGKIKVNSSAQGIEKNPKLMFYTDNPLNILVKEVEEKNKFMIERGYWKLNANEKLIYQIVQDVRYRLQSKKFQQLLMGTFEDNMLRYEPIHIKKGIIQGSGQPIQLKLVNQNLKAVSDEEEPEDLPDFLKNSFDKVEEDSVIYKPSRLSIIPEIQSVIENSNYQQKQKQKLVKSVRVKREVNEGLFRIVQLILAQSQFQKAQYDNDIAKILPVYNKMRTSSKYNNYYQEQMFRIFMETGNYKSVIVLVAEILDFLEQRGIRKMDKLPYWMHKYLFVIIEEKGLKFLNQMLQKMNFYDEAIIDTIEMAKNWKMKGVTY